MNKPSIVEIVGARVELRRTGKELIGLCPFHADTTPSFSVNEDKGVFHCFGCGVGGDVIRFVELIEKCSFKDAVKILKLDDDYKPQTRPHKSEAQQITAWARETSIKARGVLREISDKIRVCALARKDSSTDKQLIAQHEAGLIREWAILSGIDDDLNDAKAAIELYAQRGDIERLIEPA